MAALHDMMMVQEAANTPPRPAEMLAPGMSSFVSDLSGVRSAGAPDEAAEICCHDFFRSAVKRITLRAGRPSYSSMRSSLLPLVTRSNVG